MRIRYAALRDPFFDDVTRRVSAYFAAAGIPRRAGPRMWAKTAVLVLSFAALATAIFSGRLRGVPFVLAFALWNFVQFLSTIGIAHDAAHDAYAKSRRANRWIMRLFDLLGIDSTRWIENHLRSHHAMPNVPSRDSAIESFSLVRLHPRTRRARVHRWQHVYMFAVYALVTIFQVYLLEPISFAQRLTGFSREPGWGRALAWMIAKKLVVLGWSLVLPLAVLPNPWREIAGGWLAGHLVCGVALGVIFMTTHLHRTTSFVEPDADGVLPMSFAAHVLATTSEFSVESRIITWLAGGLNLHVTHHLFPHVSQTHLPALSRIVRETAREHGAPYVSYTLWGALRSHVDKLRELGAAPSFSFPLAGAAGAAALAMTLLAGCDYPCDSTNSDSAAVGQLTLEVSQAGAVADANLRLDAGASPPDTPRTTGTSTTLSYSVTRFGGSTGRFLDAPEIDIQAEGWKVVVVLRDPGRTGHFALAELDGQACEDVIDCGSEQTFEAREDAGLRGCPSSRACSPLTGTLDLAAYDPGCDEPSDACTKIDAQLAIDAPKVPTDGPVAYGSLAFHDHRSHVARTCSGGPRMNLTGME
jgi:linoleoyl-CoA desaturase